MSNDQSSIPSTFVNAVTLDADFFDDTWQEVLDRAVPYGPRQDQYPSLVLPVPNRNDSLIVSENKYYYSSNQTFTTLKRHKSVLQTLDYTLWSRTLKHFDCLPKRKLPLTSRTSCLFPLTTSIDHALWMNPAKIEEVKTIQGLTHITMTDGTTVITFVHRRTVIGHVENALFLLATLRRDYLYTDFPGQTPLDYLDLPDTPFLRLIGERELLQEFTLPLHALKQQYENQRVIQLVIDLGQTVDLNVLTYTSFSDLLASIS